jgi:TM2 domain-containing membrane protein YozV
MSQYQPPAYQPPQGYRPPPQQQGYQPQQPPYPYYPQQHHPQQQPVQHVVHHYRHPPKSAGTAVLLEILPGFFFQTFGIGHIYAGNVGLGLLFMFGYWFVAFVNFLLLFVLVGLITWPLCFLVTLIISSILASNAASRSTGVARR